MSRRLDGQVSSQYFEAANRMRPKAAGIRIAAYVESYDDVYFWRTALEQFETPGLAFEIMLPSHTGKLERGKKAVMMSLLARGAGPAMVACVDADYDYLVQGATKSSAELLRNPFVLHTYAYSIESMACYAPSLHGVCVAATLNDRRVFDFGAFLGEYSKAVYPLFVWNIMFYRTPEFSRFSITDFIRAIETGGVTPRNAAEAVSRLAAKVSRKAAALAKAHPSAAECFSQTADSLLRLGVTPSNTYMYIQGHHLFDRVVLPLLSKVCDQLVREREQEISRQSVHGTQRRNELSSYTHSRADLEEMLKKNNGFLQSPQYALLKADVEALVEKVKAAAVARAQPG